MKCTLALLTALAFIAPLAAKSDVLVATHTIRSRTILAPSDIKMIEGDVPGTLIAPDEAIGLEARVVLYAGRPIRIEDVGPAAIIERNEIVELIYIKSGLHLATEARALGRAGIGDSLRVMNLASRSTVTGIVAPDGSVQVGSLRAAFN